MLVRTFNLRSAIAFAAVLAALLFAASAQRSLSLARQTRLDLAAHAAAIEEQILRDPSRCSLILSRARLSSNGRIAWIRLRDPDGVLLARAGFEKTSGGLIVGKFPIRLPVVQTRPEFRLASAAMGVLEIAAYRAPSKLRRPSSRRLI